MTGWVGMAPCCSTPPRTLVFEAENWSIPQFHAFCSGFPVQPVSLPSKASPFTIGQRGKKAGHTFPFKSHSGPPRDTESCLFGPAAQI